MRVNEITVIYKPPLMGRFISEDPIRDGLNWYVYANNNPLKFVDPTGLWTFNIGVSAAGGGVVGGKLESGFAIGYDKDSKVLSFGIYQSAGGGSVIGASGSVSITAGVSQNPTVQELGGKSWATGGSAGELITAGGEVSVPIGNDGGSETSFKTTKEAFNGETDPNFSASIGIGGGLTPVEAHSQLTVTAVQSKEIDLLQVAQDIDSSVEQIVTGEIDILFPRIAPIE